MWQRGSAAGGEDKNQMEMTVKLQVFEGPLDLLFALAREE